MVTPVKFETKNYVEPAGLRIQFIKNVIPVSQSGQVVSFADSSSDPSLDNFVAQSVIIDARNLSAGSATIYFGLNKYFSIDIDVGTFKSYLIPAFVQCVFQVDFAAGSAGSVEIDLMNYPVIPQDYSPTTATTGATQVENAPGTTLEVSAPSTAPLYVEFPATPDVSIVGQPISVSGTVTANAKATLYNGNNNTTSITPKSLTLTSASQNVNTNCYSANLVFANATLSAAGTLTVNIGAAAIPVYIPAAGFTGIIRLSGDLAMYIGAVSLSTALSSGSVTLVYGD